MCLNRERRQPGTSRFGPSAWKAEQLLPTLLSKDLVNRIEILGGVANRWCRTIDGYKVELADTTEHANNGVTGVVIHRQELALAEGGCPDVVGRIYDGEIAFSARGIHGDFGIFNAVIAIELGEPLLRSVRTERGIQAIARLR